MAVAVGEYPLNCSVHKDFHGAVGIGRSLLQTDADVCHDDSPFIASMSQLRETSYLAQVGVTVSAIIA